MNQTEIQNLVRIFREFEIDNRKRVIGLHTAILNEVLAFFDHSLINQPVPNGMLVDRIIVWEGFDNYLQKKKGNERVRRIIETKHFFDNLERTILILETAFDKQSLREFCRMSDRLARRIDFLNYEIFR